MGFSTNNKKGPVSEINVTPLVDVMLVLLVIFMITAPLLFNGIPLNLPKAKKVENVNLSDSQIILSITKDGKYFVGETQYKIEELVPKIKTMFKTKGSDVVFVRADYAIMYGEVAKIMSILKRGSIANIALVTEIEK